MSKPDIFMDEFRRDPLIDQHFAALGRAVSFAARFEADCCALAALLDVIHHAVLIMEDPQEFDKLYKEIYRRRLFKQIQRSASNNRELKELLHEGRQARNVLIHEVIRGADWKVQQPSDAKSLVSRLRSLTTKIASAHVQVAFLISYMTNEPVPGIEFIELYPHHVADWVCNLSEVDI